ncbi:hypothetical protein J6590_098968 [Homalodisca vitripennis]|nr:hypothetical protein J6590_098968 [Homalodisca vitripennis]
MLIGVMADRVGNGRRAQTQGYRRRLSDPTPMRRQEWRWGRVLCKVQNNTTHRVSGVQRLAGELDNATLSAA